jgi:ABC-type uncharacterized transport system permease subunit
MGGGFVSIAALSLANISPWTELVKAAKFAEMGHDIDLGIRVEQRLHSPVDSYDPAGLEC